MPQSTMPQSTMPQLTGLALSGARLLLCDRAPTALPLAPDPLGHLMQSVFGMHDRSRLEVYCYSLRKNDGSCFRKTIELGAEQ
eukprot:6823120-Prymnesium_polylepis.1